MTNAQFAKISPGTDTSGLQLQYADAKNRAANAQSQGQTALNQRDKLVLQEKQLQQQRDALRTKIDHASPRYTDTT